MSLRNTPHRYGRVAQALHWTVALLFLLAFVSVYVRQYLTTDDTTPNWVALQAHLSLGLSVILFAALRLWWKLANEAPANPPGTWWEHLAAHAAHWTLYLLMFAMPLTGYLGTGVDTDFFGLFTIPKFEDTAIHTVVVQGWLGLTPEAFEEPVDWLHKQLGEVFVLLLVGLHVAAALYHHYVRRDDVLTRMLPERREAAPAPAVAAE